MIDNLVFTCYLQKNRPAGHNWSCPPQCSEEYSNCQKLGW